MKAIVVTPSREHPEFQWTEVPSPTPGPKEVLVRVSHTSVNRADLLQARGLYPPPKGASEVLGLECAGIIEELGTEASALNPALRRGLRVMALLTGGGYAQLVTADARCVVPAPASLEEAKAGSFLETYLTAYLNIFVLGEAKPGDTILLHGGSGGVGTASLGLCRQAGIRTLCTVSSAEKAERCLQRGASAAINYKTSNFSKEVLQHTDGRGVSMVLDCIGAPYLEDNLRCLSPDGTLVIIGLLGGIRTELNLATLLQSRLKLVGSTLRSLDAERKGALIESFFKQFPSPGQHPDLTPELFQVFPLPEVEAAHQLLLESRHFGKVGLSVPAIDPPAPASI